jgi:DNA-binding HxlR family transcriptional regulator
MKSKNIQPNIYIQLCPSRALLSRVADKWATMALLALGDSTLRFGELKRKLEGVSQKMLAQTLRNLERDGLIAREVFSGRPLRVDYMLTARGKGLVTQLEPIVLWAQENVIGIERHQIAFDKAQKMLNMPNDPRTTLVVAGKKVASSKRLIHSIM